MIRTSLIRPAVAAATLLAGVGMALTTAAPAGAGPTAAHRCTTADLALHHTRHDLGAGQGYERIVFRNTSSSACYLSGFPGLSYVDKHGHQLGAPADRTGSSNGRITIAPGGAARAKVHFINNVSAVPGCYHQHQQAHAVGFRVYPPGSTLAMFLRDPHPACKSSKVHLVDTSAVR
jgi:hypothetical protein